MSWTATVSRIVWSGNGVTLVATESGSFPRATTRRNGSGYGGQDCRRYGWDGVVGSASYYSSGQCSESEHDWQSPIEIVGGIKENPGVWGHGGGVKILEVCMHCGCSRRTDTWAQDHNGRQGLESVSYEAGEFADDVAALRDAEGE